MKEGTLVLNAREQNMLGIELWRSRGTKLLAMVGGQKVQQG